MTEIEKLKTLGNVMREVIFEDIVNTNIQAVIGSGAKKLAEFEMPVTKQSKHYGRNVKKAIISNVSEGRFYKNQFEQFLGDQKLPELSPFAKLTFIFRIPPTDEYYKNLTIIVEVLLEAIQALEVFEDKQQIDKIIVKCVRENEAENIEVSIYQTGAIQ